MLVQANLYPNKKEAYQALQEVMDNGKALEKFKEMVKAQGGDVSYIETGCFLSSNLERSFIQSPSFH